MEGWTEAGSGSTGEIWDKEKGPIQGKYVSKHTNVGPKQSNLYKIQEDGKPTTTGVWGSTVLDGRFEEIPVGSMVKIEFKGKERGKGGNQYNNYAVFYKAQEGSSTQPAPATPPTNPVTGAAQGSDGRWDGTSQINLDDLPF